MLEYSLSICLSLGEGRVSNIGTRSQDVRCHVILSSRHLAWKPMNLLGSLSISFDNDFYSRDKKKVELSNIIGWWVLSVLTSCSTCTCFCRFQNSAIFWRPLIGQLSSYWFMIILRKYCVLGVLSI